ncbi:RNA exonuclease 4 [Chelonus insularis]|uniref:RNA exonuclease 4 n=1 Tax=Chelonus insularis TaxID=460826 RepID=UPI001589BFD2|nr:RNA exonuclease 4 [Chelonus insularis]
MLSKVMMPDAARSHLDALSTKKTLINTDIVSKKSDSEFQENKLPSTTVVTKANDKKSKNTNSNWEKFKDLVNQSGSDSQQFSDSKSPPKRPLKSSESSRQGKRKSKNNSKKRLNLNTRPVMDLGNTTLTKQVAMDCEMVGIGDGTESMLARVSIVNRHGACIYDKFVKPRETIQDYRTAVSGIRPHNVQNGEEFEVVQGEVANILKGRILVGHALKQDLSVLFLSHPKKLQRDTSRYSLFRRVSKGNTPSLKKLAAELLGINIQTGEHDSIEDARTAMELYVLYAKLWESDIRFH